MIISTQYCVNPLSTMGHHFQLVLLFNLTMLVLIDHSTFNLWIYDNLMLISHWKGCLIYPYCVFCQKRGLQKKKKLALT